MKKVYVAMSGGVDSSVAAALLKEQGYFVAGVFMKFWSPYKRGRFPLGTVPDRVPECLWKEERADAARVAAKLEIPFLTWDFTEEYGKRVVGYMLKAYKSGITPNPDIMCNREIKFGLFFDRALVEGAEMVATGHYARIASVNPKPNGNKIVDQQYELLAAVDKNKDQSYFLYTLDQFHLAKILFPIGDYTKPQVRQLAKKFGLPTAEKKDSQGVCFIGHLKMKGFLQQYIKPKKGKIVLVQKSSASWRIKNQNDGGISVIDQRLIDGVMIGEHDGAWYYTIGQRHGLDLKTGDGPYYVIDKDIQRNEIYVGREQDLYFSKALIGSAHWISKRPSLPLEVEVKTRYRSKLVKASIAYRLSPIKGRDQTVTVSQYLLKFDEPVRAIASGQAAVFYRGERVIGGGIIART